MMTSAEKVFSCPIVSYGERMPGLSKLATYRVGNNLVKVASTPEAQKSLHDTSFFTNYFRQHTTGLHIPEFQITNCPEIPDCLHSTTEWLVDIVWGSTPNVQMGEANSWLQYAADRLASATYPTSANPILLTKRLTRVEGFGDLGKANGDSVFWDKVFVWREQALVAATTSFGLAPAHNDLTYGNIGYRPDLGVILIDFEWGMKLS